VSIWELREARRALRAEKRRQLDEATIFAAIERKRAIVEHAVAQTQRTRRARARRAVHAAPQPHRPLTKSAPTPPPEAEAVPRDVLPFDEIE
jgi:hypothetical protein